jgi:predicted membrane protein
MPTRYLFGVLLLLLGVGFLIDQFNPGLLLVDRFWPVLLIIWGVNNLIRTPRRPVWSLILLVIGLVILSRTLAGFAVNAWLVIAAAILIGLGLRLLIPSDDGRRMKGASTVVRGDDQINQSVTFSAARVHVNSQAFRGGHVAVSFGGVEVDLRNANLAPEGADLRLDSVLSGIEVRVPAGWPVEVHGAPAFGGVNVQISNTEIAQPGGAALRIHCAGLFGGIEIKN